MCQEPYHMDPDLAAIANRLTGLPLARGTEQRERCMTVSQMLLARCTCEGLAFYLEAGYAQVPSGEVNRLLTRLSSIRERMAQAADVIRASNLDEEPPF